MGDKLKVLVYGATGSQASPVVHHLLAQGHEAYALTRRLEGEKAAALRQAGATLVTGEMADLDSLKSASEGMDAVALMVPAFIANPMDYPVLAQNAITAAKAAGVGLIVWNTSGSMIVKRIGSPIYDSRLDVADMLADSGLPYIILQPDVYMENWLGPWTRPFVASRHELPYPVPEVARPGWIASDDMGKLMVAALERPELANSKMLVRGTESVNGSELAAEFSKGLGREITYRTMPLDEFAAIIDEAFGPGAGEGVAAGYRFQGENPHLFAAPVDMDAVLSQLPVQMTTIAAWVEKHQLAFS